MITPENQEFYKTLAERLLPEAEADLSILEARYPERQLEPEAIVARVAPSPTGFMHIGGLYAAMVSERLAHQNDGIFYLRIEDTDQKREVEGGVKTIVRVLEDYGIIVDEGVYGDGLQKGDYGSYIQSERADIYAAVIKKMIIDGLAYPCFCSSEELEAMRTKQDEMKIKTGYYGEFAKWRNATPEEILKKLDEKAPWVIRFNSTRADQQPVMFEDLFKGWKELPANDQDIVILKSDGLPTYHLAHVVDDHFMRTTHVTRGDEWFASVPLHLQLFKALNWNAPRYGHFAPIQKLDAGARRKLSKRKDPEANAEFYAEAGYPASALIEYLLNLANSNFEDWRRANPGASNREFQLTAKKVAAGAGALLDPVKLGDISRELISAFSPAEVYKRVLAWALEFAPEFAVILEDERAYAEQVFSLERGGERARKDLIKWSDVPVEFGFFFDSLFKPDKEPMVAQLGNVTADDSKKIISVFLEIFNIADSSDEWFAKIKTIAGQFGFAPSAKEYKLEPDKFRGQVGDVARVFRLALAGRPQTPDLHSIIRILGEKRVKNRLENFIGTI
jgi:glutamyl-tRNA synthetase